MGPGRNPGVRGEHDAAVQEQSQKEEMRAAVRGDFERLEARRKRGAIPTPPSSEVVREMQRPPDRAALEEAAPPMPRESELAARADDRVAVTPSVPDPLPGGDEMGGEEPLGRSPASSWLDRLLARG